jgi:hypothetical protein
VRRRREPVFQELADPGAQLIALADRLVAFEKSCCSFFVDWSRVAEFCVWRAMLLGEIGVRLASLAVSVTRCASANGGRAATARRCATAAPHDRF